MVIPLLQKNNYFLIGNLILLGGNEPDGTLNKLVIVVKMIQ